MWLKDKTAIMRLENEIIIIIVSNTVKGITPFQMGLADHPSRKQPIASLLYHKLVQTKERMFC
ncbi:hypothetical protein F7731_00605 [Cytobacillus depressus]|uniref:Uncharacterized protein n=1 Tax=Cytobacillus depressus TaxID=1602942 RepID=A0A6L3V8W1_9BACI|nr:hypothetical protein [Cytobacillus depressus]KAB2338111.1 hypothetical protein F7731_00605 [Cytobacillus depressus]